MSEVIKLHKLVGRASVVRRKFEENHFPTMTADRRNDTTEESVEVPAAVVENEMVNTVLMKRSTIEKNGQLRRTLEEEFQRGFDAGCKAVEKQFQEELESRVSEERKKTTLRVIVQLETLMANLQKEFLHLQTQSEQIVIRFSLAVAEQILRREVLIDNKVVLQQIKEGLRRVLGVDRIKVRVNPIDEAMVREHRAAIASGSDSIRDMVIEADEKVERGGCILESDSGNVDARISTQLKKIEATLLDKATVS